MATENSAEPEADSKAELKQMVRRQQERIDQLEAELEQLRNASVTRTQLNHCIGALAGPDSLDSLNDDPISSGGKEALEHLADRIAAVETKTGKHESIINETPGAIAEASEQHWRSVVEYAHAHKDQASFNASGPYVKLTKENVAAATNLSERRGAQLIDEWAGNTEHADSKPGTRFFDYENNKNANGKGNARKKQIHINIDYWENPADQ